VRNVNLTPLSCSGVCELSQVEPALEPFDSALGVNDALLASEERVAVGANLNAQLRLG
jgi:hypothetical protein